MERIPYNSGEPWIGLPGGEMVEVIEPLNVSGESVVLLGRQHHLNRLVALKVMPAGKSRERLLAVLEHEHIVRVFSETLDFREARRLVCMQYVPGPDLGKLLPVLADRDRKSLTGVDLLGLIDAFARQAPIFQGTLAKNRTEFSHLSFDEAVAQWGQQLAEALRHAHSQGMAHLNIKPENILLSPYGRAYLSDFGVLKRRPSEEDWRNDLHALKQVLFRLAGKTPAPVRPRPSYFTLNLEGILGDEAPVTSPEALRDRLIGFNELKKVEQALPRPGPMMRFTLAYPFVALISFRVLPHLVGTAFGAIYCFFRRGATLTGDEKAKLMTLVRAYNSISYPSGIILTILIALGVIRAFRRRALLPVANGAEAAELRRQTLLLPMKLAAVNCLTWWPSIGVLGVGAYWITGRLNWIGYVHFTTAVLLSWLIATSYSTLYCLFFSVQALYPRFLEPEPGIREAARRELQCTRRVLRWLPATLVLVPLSLALLLTQAGPGEFTPEKFLWFRGVLAFLIAAGGVGFVVSMFGLHRLGAVTRALSE